MGKLSPNSAGVWLNCPKSPVMVEHLLKHTNEYMQRGSDIHINAAIAIRKLFGIPQIDLPVKCEEEDDGIVRDYATFVKECVNNLFANKAKGLLVEEKISMADLVHVGNGIVDFAAFDEHTLLVLDLKTGHNKVLTQGNPQLYLYALALVNLIKQNYGFDIYNIFVGICQPPRDNSQTFYLTYEDLMAWYDCHREAIDSAFYDTGDYVVGRHCSNCSARAICKHNLIYFLTGGNTDEDDSD